MQTGEIAGITADWTAAGLQRNGGFGGVVS